MKIKNLDRPTSIPSLVEWREMQKLAVKSLMDFTEELREKRAKMSPEGKEKDIRKNLI